MKKLLCSQMGGPATCNAELSGNTPEQTVMNGMVHVEQAHPDMAATVKAMSPEDTAKWMDEFRKKWDALPEA